MATHRFQKNSNKVMGVILVSILILHLCLLQLEKNKGTEHSEKRGTAEIKMSQAYLLLFIFGHCSLILLIVKLGKVHGLQKQNTYQVHELKRAKKYFKDKKNISDNVVALCTISLMLIVAVTMPLSNELWISLAAVTWFLYFIFLYRMYTTLKVSNKIQPETVLRAWNTSEASFLGDGTNAIAECFMINMPEGEGKNEDKSIVKPV